MSHERAVGQSQGRTGGSVLPVRPGLNRRITQSAKWTAKPVRMSWPPLSTASADASD